jgi:hypothetical protein
MIPNEIAEYIAVYYNPKYKPKPLWIWIELLQ